MKVIITGTEGCVGSHLTQFLRARNIEVVEFQGDITSWDDWMGYAHTKFDILIHLAAIAGVRRSFSEPEFYYHNNVNGTDNALAFGSMVCDKVLYASSSNAYEWWGNPYAATKMMCEVLGRHHDNAKGMRFHTVWPGRDDMLYKKLSKGEVEYINGNHSRDWIHVNDLCNAILTVIENWSTIDKKVLDFGTGNTFNVLEMAQTIFNWTGEIRDENPQGERVKTQADVQYLYDLGWKPEKDILDESCHTK